MKLKHIINCIAVSVVPGIICGLCGFGIVRAESLMGSIIFGILAAAVIGCQILYIYVNEREYRDLTKSLTNMAQRRIKDTTREFDGNISKISDILDTINRRDDTESH